MHGGKAVIRNSQNVKPFNMGVELVNWTGRQSATSHGGDDSVVLLCMVSRSSGGCPAQLKAKESPTLLLERTKKTKRPTPRAVERHEHPILSG